MQPDNDSNNNCDGAPNHGHSDDRTFNQVHEEFGSGHASSPKPETGELPERLIRRSAEPPLAETANSTSGSTPAIKRAPEATRSEATSRLLWMLTTAAIVLVAWRIGPKIAEEYQFALTSGRIRAEYQNAVELLRDSPLENVSKSYQLVAQKIRPSVVSIKTMRHNNETRGQGSGVVMSSDGYILTNAHVVEKTNEIEVVLYNRHRYFAELVGIDNESDLAVIKIDAPRLIPAIWGDSDEVKVGSIVWAIGSPYGLNQTVTCGIISGKHRQDEQHRNRELFQTDAAVNPGNSGGPLVDALGQVIGINTSIYGDTFQGISFAVPSIIANFVYQQLIEDGKVTRGYLGVRPDSVFQDDAYKMNLPNLDGAVLTKVERETPAYEGGLRENDIILEWNHQPITVYSMLFRYVAMTPPNETVSVLFARDGAIRELDIKVGDRSEYPEPIRRQFYIPGR